MRTKRLRSSAIRVATIAVMAAMLSAGKAALMTIPNVEIVTLLTALYGYVFGWMGLAATMIFVWLETMLWGFNTWVFAYILHWGAVCITCWVLGRLRIKNRVAVTLAAVLLTIAFGVSSSLIDVAMYMRDGALRWDIDNYWYRFGIYYMRGIWFYVVEVACNLVVFPLLFPTLSRFLGRFARRYGLGKPDPACDHAIEPPDPDEDDGTDTASPMGAIDQAAQKGPVIETHDTEMEEALSIHEDAIVVASNAKDAAPTNKE